MCGRTVTTSAKPVRLVVDVNVLISSLMGGELAGLSAAFADARFHVCTTNEQLAELLEVVERPKFRKYFTLAEGRAFFADFCLIAESTSVKAPYEPVSRDPKDDYLLALAKAAKADLLITGDEDLLVLKKYGKTRILKPSVFKREFL